MNVGMVVLDDNMRSHYVKKISEIIEQSDKHLSLLYLLLCSLDFNPIEMMWSKIKSILRMLKTRTIDALPDAIKIAFSKVTPYDCLGWFSAVGIR